MSDIYTPAVRNLFVIFPEDQRPIGYVTNKLLNIACVYILDMVYTIYAMLYIDEVDMQYASQMKIIGLLTL